MESHKTDLSQVKTENDEARTSCGENGNENLRLIDKRKSQEHGLNDEKALISLVKGLVGTGILALPNGFSDAGLWTGLGLLILICSINIYCMRQLVFAAHFCCSKFGLVFVDYGDLAMYSFKNGPPILQKFGGVAKGTVNSFIFVTQFGFCCVYFVFMADNTKQVVDHYIPNNGISQRAWMALYLVPVLALSSIRSLKGLSPFSALANVLYLLGFVVTFQYLFHDLSAASSLPEFKSFSTLPLFFGTTMFSFEGVCLVLPIENRMYQPHRFIDIFGVLNTGCLFVTLLYSAIGFFGYIRFGENVKDAITLNLPNQWYYQSVKIMFVVAVWVTYSVQFHVPMEVIDRWMKSRVGNRWLITYGVRFLIWG